MLSLISQNDPSDRAVLLRCANTLSYIHGLSGSYDTESWKYYIINLRFSKHQQIFRPRIILLIQVYPKKCIVELVGCLVGFGYSGPLRQYYPASSHHPTTPV